LAWKTVVKEKNRGGLGIGFVLAKNKAFLFKWIWKLGCDDKANWANLIRKKYKPSFSNELPQFSKRFSVTLRCIYSTTTSNDQDNTLMRNSYKLQIGKGNQVKF
jgi:hypothetical protein